MRGTVAQHIDHTAARRSGPRRWLDAVRWLLAAGLHPRATAVTLALAEDLAARMDFDSGHVRYGLESTAARLGVSTKTVKVHAAVLRELGALAWVVHGTRTNIRRLMGLGGYAGTATVYAAVIPAVYDHAMGHRVVGTGYNARIVIDHRGLESGQDRGNRLPDPAVTGGTTIADGSGERSSVPPSLTLVKEEGQVHEGEGFEDTPARARESAPTQHPAPTTNSAGNRPAKRADRKRRQQEKAATLRGTTGRSPSQVAAEIRATRLVRALVNWTQGERNLRRLAFVLRPFFDRGLDARAIAAELNGLALSWRPASPAAFIRARLAEQAAHEEARHAREEAESAAEEAAARAAIEALLASAPARPDAWYEAVQQVRADHDRPGRRTDAERAAARLDWNLWPQVADHHRQDPDDALDLYGPELVAYALRQEIRRSEAAAVGDDWARRSLCDSVR